MLLWKLFINKSMKTWVPYYQACFNLTKSCKIEVWFLAAPARINCRALLPAYKRPYWIISQLCWEPIHFLYVIFSENGFTLIFTLKNDVNKVFRSTSLCFYVLLQSPVGIDLIDVNNITLETTNILLSMHVGELHTILEIWKIVFVLLHHFFNLNINE
jgi:hypothetical protein